MKLTTMLVPVLLFVLAACDDGPSEAYIERTRACEPLPVIDGYRIAKMEFRQSEGESTLRLPQYVQIDRKPAIYGECEYIESLSIDYLWYRGELIPGWQARADISSEEFIRVYVAGRVVGQVDDLVPRDSRRFIPSLPHNIFPLDYYPRYLLDDPDNPSELSLSLARVDHFWGIRDTRYKSFDGLPFTAACTIPAVDPDRPDSRVEGAFADFGDSKCRGRVGAVKNGVYLSVLIDVWADGASDINLIYDAVVEQLQAFIQE